MSLFNVEIVSMGQIAHIVFIYIYYMAWQKKSTYGSPIYRVNLLRRTTSVYRLYYMSDSGDSILSCIKYKVKYELFIYDYQICYVKYQKKKCKNLILYKMYFQENMFTDIKIFWLKKPQFGSTIFDSTPPTMLTKAFFFLIKKTT